MAKPRTIRCNSLWTPLVLIIVVVTVLGLLKQLSLPRDTVDVGENSFRSKESVTVYDAEITSSSTGRSGTAAPMQPIVLALALSYPLRIFQNFLLPLRAVYKGDVLLFVDDKLDSSVASLIDSMPGVHTRSATRVNTSGTHHQTYRYFLYAHACRAPYTHCFLSDFRDVYFQADPFPRVATISADLIFQQECGPTPIKMSKFNSNWVNSCYGDAAASGIMDALTLCSGTIMGSPRGIQVLYDVMSEAKKRASDKCNCKGCDQGLVNGMVHLHLLPTTISYTIQRMGEGIVNTVGSCRASHQNESFLPFLRHLEDGTLAPVLHQQDRFKLLNEVVRKEINKLL